MISLGTSVSDLILQRTLLESTLGLNSAIERMSTGYMVNHAKDNAAGYSIIDALNTRVSSMLQIQNNTEIIMSMSCLPKARSISWRIYRLKYGIIRIFC